MNIAATVRTARNSSGLSQEQLASLAGVPQSTVGRIEAGLTVPGADTLQRLLALCGWRLGAAPIEAADKPTPDHDPLGRPYFLWDVDMTWDGFRAALTLDDADVRGWAYSRLLEYGRWTDIWKLVTREDVVRNLPATKFRAKAAWELMFEADAA